MTNTDDATPCFTYEPEVAFRGARTYVHSTTLYRELLAGAEAFGLAVDGAITLRVRRLILHQPVLRYFRSSALVSDQAAAVFSLQAGSASLHGEVTDGDRPVLKREQYDETLLATLAIQDGQAIEASDIPIMSPFEIITSLNLLLHHRLFTLPDNRKWYLATIELDRPLLSESTRRIRIELIRTLGTIMTRATILTNSQRIGHLEYIKGPVTDGLST